MIAELIKNALKKLSGRGTWTVHRRIQRKAGEVNDTSPVLLLRYLNPGPLKIPHHGGRHYPVAG